MPIQWPDEIDEIITGDLTAGLAFVTPAGGAVITAVAPVGLRDREAGTVTFTTSLGFGKKLDRIRRDPRVSLAYHAREHGFSSRPEFVLVQGRASIVTKPDPEFIEHTLGPAAERFMGKQKRGRFWDRWLQEYYQDRVPVTVQIERVAAWPDLTCKGQPQIYGARAAGRPAAAGASRPREPGRGSRSTRRQRSSRRSLTGCWPGSAETASPTSPRWTSDRRAQGIELATNRRLPPGGRRAACSATATTLS